jgi:hypothetical protein
MCITEQSEDKVYLPPKGSSRPHLWAGQSSIRSLAPGCSGALGALSETITIPSEEVSLFVCLMT